MTIGQRTLTNHNKLLSSYEGCIGVKTGYTKAAGRTLVSAARREGQTLVAVTLSDGNDWLDHTNLLDYGFSAYPQETLLATGEQVTTLPVKGGTCQEVALVAKSSIFYPVAAGEEITFTVECPAAVTAPLPAGTVVGRVVAYCGGEEAGAAPLVTSQDLSMDLSGVLGER